MSISSVPSAKPHGVDETLSGLGGMFAMSRQLEVVHRRVDGPEVLAWFEPRTTIAAPMPIVKTGAMEGRPRHPEPGRVRPTPMLS
jgi:hypothetical protein